MNADAGSTSFTIIAVATSSSDPFKRSINSRHNVPSLSSFRVLDINLTLNWIARWCTYSYRQSYCKSYIQSGLDIYQTFFLPVRVEDTLIMCPCICFASVFRNTSSRVEVLFSNMLFSQVLHFQNIVQSIFLGEIFLFINLKTMCNYLFTPSLRWITPLTCIIVLALLAG